MQKIRFMFVLLLVGLPRTRVVDDLLRRHDRAPGELAIIREQGLEVLHVVLVGLCGGLPDTRLG